MRWIIVVWFLLVFLVQVVDFIEIKKVIIDEFIVMIGVIEVV